MSQSTDPPSASDPDDEPLGEWLLRSVGFVAALVVSIVGTVKGWWQHPAVYPIVFGLAAAPWALRRTRRWGDRAGVIIACVGAVTAWLFAPSLGMEIAVASCVLTALYTSQAARQLEW